MFLRLVPNAEECHCSVGSSSWKEYHEQQKQYCALRFLFPFSVFLEHSYSTLLALSLIRTPNFHRRTACHQHSVYSFDVRWSVFFSYPRCRRRCCWCYRGDRRQPSYFHRTLLIPFRCVSEHSMSVACRQAILRCTALCECLDCYGCFCSHRLLYVSICMPVCLFIRPLCLCGLGVLMYVRMYFLPMFPAESFCLNHIVKYLHLSHHSSSRSSPRPLKPHSFTRPTSGSCLCYPFMPMLPSSLHTIAPASVTISGSP